ncbi:putative ATP-dependent endonuclease of OLD family [Bradyrhizobium yuanmingense]|uniref:ATP-dependent nuclease n=1 Tax=Bradyrhizobium yuanmingense TaxID=108015 RepID=UPI0035136245
MVRIRLVEIQNFRGIRSLKWAPKDGINCLIGPGDSCKTSILDAIDYCLGARRFAQFTDADFHKLDVEQPVSISCTLGALSDRLKNIEAYGLYLRAFDPSTETVEDEPRKGTETALTVNLTIGSDLEPVWTLVSQRAADQGQSRNLSWADRQAISPTRLGALAEGNLVWRRGSILNKLSEERADVTAALAKAAREARSAFGDKAGTQLIGTLDMVKSVASYLGIPVGKEVKAMLDAHSVSFGGGTISLHNEHGIPLRGLGVGSTRLLIAGLQRMAASDASIVLIDELEHGLEPHRIHRLLDSIGSKEKVAPLQAFVSTHSPVALRELSGGQLVVVRQKAGAVDIKSVGDADDIQSAIRTNPEAFLAPTVIVCEGASEVGLLKGVDQYRVNQGQPSLTAHGVALVDAGGVEKIHKRANAFLKLGYAVRVLRDDDKEPDSAEEKLFLDGGGVVSKWAGKRKLEQELFHSLPDASVQKLLDLAVELHTEKVVDDHINTVSSGNHSYNGISTEHFLDNLTAEMREVLGNASSIRRSGWFKSVSWMEEAAREIVAPALEEADPSLRNMIAEVFKWISDDR